MTSANGLQDALNKFAWFHQIDFGGGVVSPGLAPLSQLRAQADIYFKAGIAGKSVLDIGCWDGFNSIEAIRRGARRVLATDHYVWAHHRWASRATIELARQFIAPSLEIRDIDVPDLTVDSVGVFDIVLFCGVFYHLRNPFQVLEGVALLAAETLIVETHLDASDIARPAMIFYPGTELNDDPTNWWGPNRQCVEAMLRDLRFAHVDFHPHPTVANRGIFLATR
jgi:tRNA (mo5U34)-methyltransferase